MAKANQTKENIPETAEVEVTESNLETDIENFKKTSEELNTKTKQLAETEIELMEREKEALLKEAKTLGITPSRFTFSGSKIKDLDAEQLKCEKLMISRLKIRIAKAKAKGTAEQQRKTHLLARLKRPQDYPPEVIAQAKYELMKMEQKQWRPGIRMPKKKTVYDEITNS